MPWDSSDPFGRTSPLLTFLSCATSPFRGMLVEDSVCIIASRLISMLRYGILELCSCISLRECILQNIALCDGTVLGFPGGELPVARFDAQHHQW